MPLKPVDIKDLSPIRREYLTTKYPNLTVIIMQDNRFAHPTFEQGFVEFLNEIVDRYMKNIPLGPYERASIKAKLLYGLYEVS